MTVEPAGFDPIWAPLRVTLVLWSGNVGGAETQSVSLAGRLRTLGVEASVIFICGAMPLGARLSELAVPFTELGFRRGTQVFLAPQRMTRALKAARPDVIILAQGSPLAPLARIGSPRSAIIHVQHTGYFWYSHSRRALERLGGLCQRYFVDVDVAVSDFVLDAMRGQFHAPRTERIYNGVELSRFRPRLGGSPRESVVVAYAGRLGAGKGVEDLIEAAARVRSQRPFELLIAGAGPMRESLERLAAARLAPHAFRFVGQQKDMPAFWSACDLAVVPSHGLIESFGMVAAEAMACGKAVIASRAGGLREVVAHAETGMLFEPGNTHELAACIAAYVENAAMRMAHGAAARDRVARLFDIDTTARSYIALGRELAESRRP